MKEKAMFCFYTVRSWNRIYLCEYRCFVGFSGEFGRLQMNCSDEHHDGVHRVHSDGLGVLLAMLLGCE